MFKFQTWIRMGLIAMMLSCAAPLAADDGTTTRTAWSWFGLDEIVAELLIDLRDWSADLRPFEQSSNQATGHVQPVGGQEPSSNMTDGDGLDTPQNPEEGSGHVEPVGEPQP